MDYYYNLSEYDKEEEFKYIFQKYLLPLLGMVKDDVKIIEFEKSPRTHIELLDSSLRFAASLKSAKGFKVDVSSNFDKSYINIIRKVFAEIIKITYNDLAEIASNKRNKSYLNFHDIDMAYQQAVQRGIIQWFFIDSHEKADEKYKSKINRLLCTIERWSRKTYEGKKVPFAFVINQKSTSGSMDYLNFFEEEYSATLSDGVNSIIELDSNFNFLSYESITENNEFRFTPLTSAVPYRFSQVIEHFTKDKLGIFLLVSGDIILVKNSKVELVKREGYWINFNKDIFINVILNENRHYKIGNELIKEQIIESVYATSLDVSFSHGGGIIAITDQKDNLINNNLYDYLETNYDEIKNLATNEIRDKMKENSQSIIDYVDCLCLPIPNYNYLCKNYDKVFDLDNDNIIKRFNKREMLKILVQNKKFSELDRKLRTELVGMDGATIIDPDGNIIAIGAIIQNDSGSYGGGRGAAAKKLSNYGLAVKISTDGYIEVYSKGNIKYRIK